MYLSKLELENVRPFSHFQCDFSEDINLIYGGNGIGKTTILESIYILSISKSFRSGKRKNIVKQGAENLSIKGCISDDNGESIKIDYYKFREERRIKINEDTLSRVTDLIGLFPVVIMSPEDEDIISGSALNRRNFINRLFSIVDKQYLKTLKDFERIRKHRNVLLQIGDYDQAITWETPFVETGFQIWQKRRKYIKAFITLFKLFWKESFPDLEASIEYKSLNCANKEAFFEKLRENRKIDYTNKRNSYGPHRDDLYFSLNCIELRNFGSQGEKKIFLSVLKKAEAAFISSKLNKKPVILLDDLFAKLDEERSHRIVHLFKKNFQTFITSTDLNISGLFDAEGANINQIKLSRKTACFSN